MTKGDFILMHISTGLLAYDVNCANNGNGTPRFSESTKEDKIGLINVFINEAENIWEFLPNKLKL